MVSRSAVDQVIVLLADGVRADILQELLDNGELPGIERTFLEGREKTITTGVTAFPSTTGPAHLPFLTGCFPGSCNIPGIRWLDPTVFGSKLVSPSRFRSYMGLGNFFLARDMTPRVSTLFENVRDHRVIAGNVRRGVRWTRDLTRASKVVQNIKSFVTEDWTGLDRIARDKVLTAAASGTPLVFAAFYGADSNGHKQGPRGCRTLAAYRYLDGAVGSLGALLRAAGREERTLICLLSDHGMSSTVQHIDLHAVIDGICGPCLAHPAIWRGYFAARSAVMVSGNAMAHVYVKGDMHWQLQYLDAPGKDLAAVVEVLLAIPGIDQIAGRCRDGAIRVLTSQGSANIREPEPGVIDYTVQGLDPFGYPDDIRGVSSDRKMLARTFATAYPDAPRQLLQLFQSPRCGHLVVTAAPGYDLRARNERPPHLGSHGSLHREHMIVPVLLNRPAGAAVCRTIDIFPTVLKALGLPVRSGVEGISLI